MSEEQTSDFYKQRLKTIFFTFLETHKNDGLLKHNLSNSVIIYFGNYNIYCNTNHVIFITTFCGSKIKNYSTKDRILFIARSRELNMMPWESRK